MSKGKAASHPSEYLIPAKDSKGHAELYHFRAPDDWGRRMEEIVISHRFPFSTPSDIMRWCVYVGLDQLARIQPEITDLSQIVAASRVVRDVEDRQRFLDLFRRVATVIDQAVEDKDEGTARQLLADLRFEFEKMPPGPSRDRYLERLQKWDWLLSKAKPASPLDLAPAPKIRRPKRQSEDE